MSGKYMIPEQIIEVAAKPGPPRGADWRPVFVSSGADLEAMLGLMDPLIFYFCRTVGGVAVTKDDIF
jgi:hypothetical protein